MGGPYYHRIAKGIYFLKFPKMPRYLRPVMRSNGRTGVRPGNGYLGEAALAPIRVGVWRPERRRPRARDRCSLHSGTQR